LGDFIDNALLTLTPTSLKVSLKGRLLIRNICMVFDHYLREKQEPLRYSKTI
jgi:oxygen-independent coproporphyrinogen-3 oxidase